MSRVLVLGGGGHLGSAVVRALSHHDVVPTWCHREIGGPRVDLTQAGAVDRLFDTLGEWVPDHVVHCAGLPATTNEDEDGALWRMYPGTAIALGRTMLGGRGGEPPRNAPPVPTSSLVFFSALAPGQSFPVAPAFAASQAGLCAAVMALGHSHGPRGFRVNVVALGLLDGGAAGVVTAGAREAYLRFSALRRVGTADEAAATARWLIEAAHPLNGKVLAANGGL